MIINMTVISTIIPPMTMMTKTVEPMSYLMMTMKIVATMSNDTTIVFLANTTAHLNMDPMHCRM